MAARRLAGAVLVAATLLLSALWVVRGWTGPGRAPRALTVAVPPGATLAGAADRLERAGAIGSARGFRLGARLFGERGSIRAGEYRIAAHASPADILRLLQSGRTLQRLVTIPEGLPSVMARDALMAARELTGTPPVPAEGSLLPDSYDYSRGEARGAVVARMQAAMTRYLAAAWARRRPGLVVATPRAALILASIVEKETGKPAERRIVAAVYANRLRIGMPLQADPTFIYPITQGRPLGRRPLLSEVRARNAYNTYTMVGLPAGPICNPGRLSIDAVLNPAPTRALYLVADGTGGHVFAETLEQHNANVKRWYAIRHARGEM